MCLNPLLLCEKYDVIKQVNWLPNMLLQDMLFYDVLTVLNYLVFQIFHKVLHDADAYMVDSD